MAWQPHGTAWRQCLAPLRQEAAAKGMVARPSLQLALDSLRVAAAEIPENELVADLSFLVQQLLGPPAYFGSLPRDISAHLALCRLLAGIAAVRTIRLHAPAANLILAALRQWADADQAASLAASPSASALLPSSASSTSSAAAEVPSQVAPAEADPPASSLQLEALAAIAALLPNHLGLLSEHERAAQLAALHSLLASSRRGHEGRPSELLECQCLALSTLTACCGPAATTTTNTTTNTHTTNTSNLTTEEAGALLSSSASLLQTCACRSRPVEDSAHCRLYTGLVRALQAAVGEAKQAWVARAAMLVEGLQRFLTYGVQASLTAAVTPTSGPNGTVTAPPPGLGSITSSGAAGGGGGSGRYRPPHLRRRESQTDAGCSDSDLSDTEHTDGSIGAPPTTGAGGAGAVVDRFRSSRVRLAVMSCIQAMAKSDPRAMHAHWTALLPLQNPLQPRPLTPHLLTVLLYDPLVKVRALAAATIATLLDGPASRSILAVAEAKSMVARAPLRGFLTLSLSLGALLLSTHSGLLHAVGHEASLLVLPGVLRALVVTMASSPYERLPPELLPQTLQVLRARWAVLSVAPATAASGELAPIHAAYMACVAECFGTKQPVAGLAAHLRAAGTRTPPQQQPGQGVYTDGAACGEGSEAGRGSSFAVDELVRVLLAVGRDAGAPAVLRIEVLAALKGLAGHYTFAMPPEAWDDLRATAEVGLTSIPPSPRASPGPRSRGDGLPSRSSSASSLSLSIPPPTRSGERPGPRSQTSSSSLAGPSGHGGSSTAAAPGSTAAASGGGGGGGSGSPEDKAAQLAVKLVSDYLAAVARHAGLCRVDPNGVGGAAVEGEGGAMGGAPPSPGYVSLTAAVPRHHHQQQQNGGQVSLVTCDPVAGEEERQGAVRRLAGMWRDVVELLVPAATSHTSYMVRAAGLACLGDVPQPVFDLLSAQLQHRMLTLLADAAAGEAVAAVRSAACKALGATAAFPPVLAHAELCDRVSRALGLCLRDSVLSVRIAAAWAVANLCDAHRKRLAAAEERPRSILPGCQPPMTRSPTDASAPNRDAAASVLSSCAPEPPVGTEPLYQPHHYQQLAALCSAAITATQDADKVRANGIRAVGNLLALLSPDMAEGLEAVNGCPGAGSGGNGSSSGYHGGVEQGRGHGEVGRADSRWGGGADVVGSWRSGSSSSSQLGHGASRGGSGSSNNTGRRESTSGGGISTAGGGLQLDPWLDAALTCLQSSLTTGGMKVQWNACYAALGLLRNPQLLAHPRVSSRMAPLLLLLVMLVRESGNFKIRTHASAALAALPCREAYGDVLPDALLVVASALEGLSSGSTTTTTGPATSAVPASKNVPGGGGAGGGGGNTDEPADWGGDDGEGRFPNFRYTASLSTQLRATLLHFLSLLRPQDARRVREALARRAEFLYSCLREQLGEAVAALRVHQLQDVSGEDGAGPHGMGACGELPSHGVLQSSRAPLRVVHSGRSSSGTLLTQRVRLSEEARSGSGALELPADPFGLSGTRGGTAPRDAGPGGLAALLAAVNLGEEAPTKGSSATTATANVSSREIGSNGAASGKGGLGKKDSSGLCEAGSGAGDACGRDLAVAVPAAEEVQSARAQVAALAAPLRGFAALLMQLGPNCDPILRDVQLALERMKPVAAVGAVPWRPRRA